MVKRPPKMSTLVVSAIRNLREIHGSTSKEIMSYIKSNYGARESTVQRQMHAALRRGLDYGILKKADGNYCLNIDPLAAYTPNMIPTEKHAKKKKKSRRGRARPRTKIRARSAKRKRSRSARRRARSKGERRARRMERGKCCCHARKHQEESVLKESVVEPTQQQDEIVDDKTFQNDRSKRSKSRERSSSRSRSSCSSDREIPNDDSQRQTD